MESYRKLLRVAVIAVLCKFAEFTTSSKDNDLLVLTVATENNDGFQRFMRSATKYGLDVKVLGMGQEWKGGDMSGTGGGYKIKLVAEAMEELKDNKGKLVMFVDSYDVVFTAGANEIKKAFNKFSARVVFGAEDYCWPDLSLKEAYPEVKSNEKRFLNSGGFIGYAPDVYAIVTMSDVNDEDDDQLYYTKVFLNPVHRKNHDIKLDTRAEIFQNLHGALDEVKLNFKGSNSFLYNMRTGLVPLVIHGNGPIKMEFNRLTNYLADQWTPNSGCLACQESRITLDSEEMEDYPEVMAALFLEHPTPFASLFFDKVAALVYPKDKIHIFIHYKVAFHDDDVKNFRDKYGADYKSLQVFGPDTELTDPAAHNKALELCAQQKCSYLFVLEGEAQIDNPDTLRHLIEQNRTMIGPMLMRPNMMWSNFWGALSKDGYYKRSEDYTDIVKRVKVGVWNVPYLALAYLIQGHAIKELIGSYDDSGLDSDMAICKRMREKNLFMYVDNQAYYGHQTTSTNCETTHLHNDLYGVLDNPYTWEQKYLHPDYRKHLLPEAVHEQPCPDVFWMPLTKPIFCKEYIEELENYGQWSGGSNYDPRLAGAYENVPTIDIHTNQIGWERHWLYILKTYIVPLAETAFKGYHSEARAIMNFAVRYRPDEQPALRPHQDSSTFTVNMALNTPGVDYEGGGTRFLRYNCSVVASRSGWLVLFPGRLTHQHEGLRTTKGTRYIMVSFVDP